jgi:hypothetical protein
MDLACHVEQPVASTLADCRRLFEVLEGIIVAANQMITMTTSTMSTLSDFFIKKNKKEVI